MPDLHIYCESISKTFTGILYNYMYMQMYGPICNFDPRLLLLHGRVKNSSISRRCYLGWVS